MKQMTFSKLALIVLLLSAAFVFLTVKAFSQDTIRNVHKVLIAKAELSRKTGKIQRVWYRKETVKKGYIVKLPNGLFVINGKEMVPDNFTYTEADATQKVNPSKKQ